MSLDNIGKPEQGIGPVWHKVEQFSFSLMEEHKLIEIAIAGKRVGLLKKKAAVYAFSATCPHAGGALCDGWIDGLGRIVCPDHKYRFDPVNGRNVSGEGYKLVTYPVEIKNDDIFIALFAEVKIQ